MGQYYNVYLEKEDGSYSVYKPIFRGDRQGSKIMEHSWFPNNFVNAICNLIYQKPMLVAWVGDYADDYEKKKNRMSEIYHRCWGDDVTKNYGFDADTPLNLKGKWLVNHTKKIAISLDDYEMENTAEDGWTIHPLPLLTAIGNGQGGGDYYGINTEYVDSWYLDSISVEDVIPDNYKTVMYHFKEILS